MRRHTTTQPPITLFQRGFTLLEALITIVVVSIGLLGILGLQTVSIANTQVSSSRSIASMAAQDMADRIRANPPGEAAGDYENISHPAASSSPADCATKTCSPDALAAFDAWDWDRSLAPPRLPDGRGYVKCGDKVAGDCRTYEITIVWRERDLDAERNSGGKPDQCDSSDFTDRCFVTLVRP